MFRRQWNLEMTPARERWGWVYLAAYLVLFPRLNGWVQQLVFGAREGEIMVAEVNVVYYAILFGLLLLIFWDFLKGDLLGLLDWLPENACGVALGLTSGVLLQWLIARLPFPVSDPILPQYLQQLKLSPAPTLLLVLLLIPLVEETVFRGVIQGHLRAYSRPLAVLVTTLLYAFCLVWRYAWDLGDPRYLMLTVYYLPMSAVLSLCYESGGSVWSCTLLHAGLNGFTLFMAL